MEKTSIPEIMKKFQWFYGVEALCTGFWVFSRVYNRTTECRRLSCRVVPSTGCSMEAFWKHASDLKTNSVNLEPQQMDPLLPRQARGGKKAKFGFGLLKVQDSDCQAI